MWNQEVGMMTDPSRRVQSVRIAKLTLTETGTYNPFYLRPYQTHVDNYNLSLISNRVAQNNGQVSGSLLAGIAGNILSPGAPDAQAVIPNGWETRRIRFVMEVHVTYSIGSTMVYFFQGYTSYPGVSAAGHVAPDMEFIFNSFTGVVRTQRMTPLGLQSFDVVSESGQLLADALAPTAGQMAPKYMMRPQDIFTGLQSQYLQGGFEYMDSANYQDFRVQLPKGAVRSARSNNLATNYMAKLIDSYSYGLQTSSMGHSQKGIIEEANKMVLETPLMENIFIRMLCDQRGVTVTNRFYFSDFERLDPNLANVTNYNAMNQMQLAQLHSAGSTSFWHGNDRETQVAAILSQAVPALMMEMLVSRFTFRSTNHDVTGRMNTVVVEAKTMTTADITKNIDLLVRRIENEVIYDITFGNQETYMIDMRCDLNGETWISLNLGSGGNYQYAAASFCDNLFVPTLTTNRGLFENVVHDIDRLVNNVTDAVGNTGAPVTQINNLV